MLRSAPECFRPLRSTSKKHRATDTSPRRPLRPLPASTRADPSANRARTLRQRCARQRFAHTPLATAPLVAELIRTAATSLMDTPVDTETGLCTSAPNLSAKSFSNNKLVQGKFNKLSKTGWLMLQILVSSQCQANAMNMKRRLYTDRRVSSKLLLRAIDEDTLRLLLTEDALESLKTTVSASYFCFSP